jgi:putative membrane protein
MKLKKFALLGGLAAALGIFGLTLSTNPLLHGLCLSVVYSVLGLGMMILAFTVIDEITPGNLAEELTAKQNIALSIVVAAMVLGVSIIIASAIAG